MTKDVYLEVLQDDLMKSLAWYMEESRKTANQFIFMQDNDPKHTAKVVSKWLNEQEFHIMEWPPQSQDLNPIENMWQLLKRRLFRDYDCPPCGIHELWDRIGHTWYQITAEECQKFIKKTWDINLLIQFIKDKLSPTAELNLQQLQLKVILLTCIDTMGRPRSDVGRLQHRDVKFITSEMSNNLEGVVLHIRTQKESQVKTSKLGLVDDKEVCLVSTLFVFMHKTKDCRVHLPEDHTLFLSYIQHQTKPPSSVRTATVGKWIHEAMKEAGVNPVFKAHSIRSASSTKAVMLGTPIDKVKEHANWSLKSNTFEKYYYKPHQRLHQSTAIQNSIFLSAEKRITLEVEAESTGIVLGTTNNTKVDEAKTENVIHTRLWYSCDI
ncbi:hypothetical protein G6F28_012879 [Rhizopus arrhizus]|nr:hypothetical protein G6F28_012879 [Rhizopus arrhizus]KAG1259076.1 hypothetical protein G6F65_015396 [Rhizopus arrhizus]